MQRDNRDHDDVRTTAERREIRENRKNPDPISQLLMWLLPALLLGVLGYYLYQKYSNPTAREAAVTTTSTTPSATGSTATETATPASAAATTTPASTEAGKTAEAGKTETAKTAGAKA